jgi:hypothetical protein
MNYRCPNCGMSLNPGELAEPTEPPGLRVIRYIDCACGAAIHFSMKDGWDRWYAVMWWMNQQNHGPANRTEDADEFYARLAKQTLQA